MSVLTLLLLLCASGAAAEVPIPSPPTVAAKGYLLVDFNSGRVLAEANADQRLEPASLTKIMTAYVVFRELQEGNISLQDQVLVSTKAWRTPGSRMFIEVGKKVPVEDLLKGMIVQSGNDASVALAEHIAGSEETFAQLMNAQAERLGMADTHFVNATGLPNPDHYTTPRDIAKVTEATVREFPDFYAWYRIKEFTFNDIKQHNRNKLLWRDDSVDGVKTGHTDSAGYCLVASARRGDMRLVSVVMGTAGEEARAKASQTLFNFGFRFFETHKLYDEGQALADLRVWKGSRKMVRLVPNRDIFVTIPRKQYKNLDARMELDRQVMAPVSKGQTLGHVRVRLDDEEVSRVPLVAAEAVAGGNIWQRIRDSALLWIE